jgi:N-acetylneuraminic acid mutarotase
MYNISSNVWTWLAGNNTINALGVYGTKGVASVHNYPGSRDDHSMVFDPIQNCIYIFGGYGYAQSTGMTFFNSIHTHINVGWLNDLWMFNISSVQWTWLSGNRTAGIRGAYGTKGIPSVNNYPGARDGHSMVFDPVVNCFYVFGGFGYDQTTLGRAILFCISLI